MEWVTPFIILTRQKAERLLESEVLLGAGGSFVGPVRKMAGLAYIEILGLSDQAFAVTVDEANTPDGPFTRTGTFVSVPDSIGQQRVCERFFPCGSYAIISFVNLGGLQTTFAFSVIGMPA